MTDVYSQEVHGMPRKRQLWQGGSRNNQVSKGESSTSASGGFRFSIKGKDLAGTVTAITVVTPFIVLFSPVLLSVFVVVFLLATGYFTAREVGVAAKTGVSRMYEYVTGSNSNRNRIREESFDRETHKIDLKDREMIDRDEQPTESGRRYEIEGESEREGSSHNLMKAATAATTGTSLVAFSGLTFIGTVIALILATPPLVIFSPVLVPALITVFLLVSGFVSSGGFGVAAATVLAWTYKLYATEGRQTETSRIFGSKPQDSRYEDTRIFGSKPQESRSEGTRRFDSQPHESRSEETRTLGSKQQDQLDKSESNKSESKLWETRDRDEHTFREGRYPTRGDHGMSQTQGGIYVVAKTSTATSIGGTLLVLSGLTFVGTVIGLIAATPLMVIFSPVLVPAVITIFLLASGLFASGGFGVAAVTSLGWLYKYVTKDQPTEMNLLDHESSNEGLARENFSRGIDTGEEGKRGTETSDRRDITRDIDEFEKGSQGAKTRDRRDFTRGVDVGENRLDRTDLKRDIYAGEEGRRDYRRTNESRNGYNQMMKAATATTAGGSLLVFSGITFAGTVISLTMATPLLVLFSPVLVPALIAMSLLATGFVSSGGFSVTGSMVLAWLYRYVTNGQQKREGGSYDNTTNIMDLKGRERTYMSDQAIRM